MSSSYHYGVSSSSSKSRRGSPGESQGAFFQTGQGGRTVLPPISSAFPTSRFPVPTYSSQFTQPRSSPGRFNNGDVSNLYSQSWAENLSPDPTASFGNYETHDRYATNQVYGYSSRTSPSLQSDDRKLPPLNTSSAGWTTYPSGYQAGGGSIRSPTASYPAEYSYSSHGAGYSYQLQHGQDNVHLGMSHSSQIPQYPGTDYPRSSSPYSSSRSAQPLNARSSSPPPVSPVSGAEESSTIKKKRKRADANQLKVLNETYSKTAFPSTEERQRLAKQLDMSPRSVQIWFQNKRQSMRQTQRQSSTAGGSSTLQSHIGGQEPIEERTQNYHAGSVPLIDSAYQTRHSPDAYKHSQVSSHRGARQHEDIDRKWY